jgi:hypothetical protein
MIVAAGLMAVSTTYLMGMTVQRLRWLGSIPLISLAWSTAALAADGEVERAPSPAASERAARGAPPVLGLMADAGVPDGAIAALVLRPADWLRLHAGGGTNTVSVGYRGGVTVLPFGVGPSLSVDVGYFREGNANALVRRIVGGGGWLNPLLEKLGYLYVNGQLGLDFGKGPVQFFVHGGVSYLRARVRNAQAVLERRSMTSPPRQDQITVSLPEDPVVRAWVPSVKLGMIVFLGGAR